MQKLFLTSLFLFFIHLFASGQTVINLTADENRTETWVFTEDTQINGNGFNITCPACDPVILVKAGVNVEITDARFPGVTDRWIAKEAGANCEVTWSDVPGDGYIRWSRNDGGED